MTEKERFELENEDGTICIKDNIRKKYIFAFICEDIDMKEGMLEECENVVNCLNQTWEQTQRFEKSNQEYITENEELKKRLYDLQKENYGNIDGIAFYQEENATLCEKISDLEYENEELKEKLNEDDKMRWSKKTEKTVQDCDGEEYNIQEIVNALNHYQRTVDELRRENHELYNRVNELRRENYELYNRVNENTNNIK